jgi:DNA-binding transcriptional regulator YdaS (Cro superfamily)
MLDVVTEAAKGAGGVVNLAREMGVNHQTFYSWNQVPAERVLVIERFSKISRHKIRPDIYGPDPIAPNSSPDDAGDAEQEVVATAPEQAGAA